MWAYRILLRFYPSSFRAEYGDEMAAVFAARLEDAGSVGARMRLWVEAVHDVLRHAVPLHMDQLRQDLRWTVRTLVRSPGFALTVVVVAGLGIGANTAVFTTADRVLLRPLPYEEPDRLVRLWERVPGYTRMEASPANYRDWREAATSFEGVEAYNSRSANLVGAGEPVRLQGAALSAGLLAMLGVRPVAGRLFEADEDVDGAPGVVLLSWRAWQRDFGGDARIVGRRILLDDEPHAVIGVLPRAFAFPTAAVDFWTTQRFGAQAFEDRDNNYLYVLARLRPGVTLEQARTEMGAIATRLEASYPVENAATGVTVHRLRDGLPWQTRLLLVGLFGASLCILLVACVNVANLFLARALERREELAVRSWLGAGRGRLVRQLLTESLVLALAGGAVGVALAYACLPMLGRLVPESLPMDTALALDLRVLLFAAGLTAVTGIGFGTVPALRAGGMAAAQLRAGRSGQRDRLGATLVMVEVAASVVLLVAAGLFLRALDEVRSTDPGFRTEGVVTLRTWLAWPRYAETSTRVAFYSRVLDEVRALPGVTHAAYTSFLPMVMGGGIWPVTVPGQDADPARRSAASLRFVTPDYFATLGIPLRQGRDIRDGDTREASFVAVVSESFARRYWPDMDPIGRTFELAFFERTVVGVVGDVRVRGLEQESEPQVYVSYQQVPDGGVPFYAPKDLAVRSSGDPLALVPALRRIVREADAEQPVTDVRLLDEVVALDTAPRRLQARALGAFAAVAFLLAAIGIHGLLSLTASQRSREIGVRMALGAQRHSILTMVLRDAMRLAVPGVLIGGVLGYVAGRSMSAILAGVRPGDALTFGAAIGIAFVMTVVGGLPPALRAARLDPNSVIREG